MMDEFRKLGKQSARRDPRTLRLANYTVALAPAPASYDLSGKLQKLGMMLNDQLGCCTCTAIGHLIQQWTAALGRETVLSDSVILSLYETIGGYIPGQPNTDNGAIEMDVLNYWVKNPVFVTHTLAAYAYLNSKAIQEAKNAIYYFGGAYIGISLPLSAQDQDIWDVPLFRTCGKGAVGSWGGHAVPIVGYDAKYVYCITWGAVKKMTWSFYTTYCDEAYALLSNDWFDQDKAPNGFSLTDLQQDLARIRT